MELEPVVISRPVGRGWSVDALVAGLGRDKGELTGEVLRVRARSGHGHGAIELAARQHGAPGRLARWYRFADREGALGAIFGVTERQRSALVSKPAARARGLPRGWGGRFTRRRRAVVTCGGTAVGPAARPRAPARAGGWESICDSENGTIPTRDPAEENCLAVSPSCLDGRAGG